MTRRPAALRTPPPNSRAMIPVTIPITLATTSSCQMRARSGKFRDSPITILAIAPAALHHLRGARQELGR